MNRLKLIVVGLLTTLALATHSRACDWDTETLLEERSRFPTALEIILGKFPRHTLAYYEWRLADRLEKLKSDPEDDLMLDDVAVSLEKLKRYDEAIEVAKKQLQRNPDRYESLANLGTFYVHDGQLSQGLKYIERAIEINPDAHFGREKYQVILVKYIMNCTTDAGLKLPLGRKRLQAEYDYPMWEKLTFYKFLCDELNEGGDPKPSLSSQELEDATKGILGMMRFSRYQSPILLEALGELQQVQSANQLAYRAFASAAMNVDDEEARRDYNAMAQRAVSWSLQSLNQSTPLEESEERIADDFRKERADAEEWFAKLAQDEKNWIAAGEAVDVRFNEKYRSIPEAIETEVAVAPTPYVYRDPAKAALWICVTSIVVLVAAATVLLLAFFKRPRQKASA